jgi:hypothetical protein
MTPSQLRKIFERNYGASAQIARDLNVHKTTISRWFRGHVQSARIDHAMRERALQLLDKERAAVSASAVQVR